MLPTRDSPARARVISWRPFEEDGYTVIVGDAEGGIDCVRDWVWDGEPVREGVRVGVRVPAWEGDCVAV